MNLSKDTIVFLIYISKYLGVALIAGSVVHIGTLGHNVFWYIILACVGLLLMTTSAIFEAKNNKQTIDVLYIGILTALALATGFLSGGIQHYFDNPRYAGTLLALGVFVAYVMFFLKDKLTLKPNNVLMVFLFACLILLISFTLTMPHTHNSHAHNTEREAVHTSEKNTHDIHANHGEDMMNMTMRDMVRMMDDKTGKALEQEFITGMIPHHQGAVNMAKKLLEDKTISLELRKFAEDIIETQEREIQMMSTWLKE